VGGGDRARRQLRVAEPRLDERVHAQHLLTPARGGRQRVPPPETGRERDREHVDQGVPSRAPPASPSCPASRSANAEAGAPGPRSPGTRTAVSRASSSGLSGSGARGKATATQRPGDIDHRAGRDRSTSVRSPGPSEASRPSWATTPRPRAITSTLHQLAIVPADVPRRAPGAARPALGELADADRAEVAHPHPVGRLDGLERPERLAERVAPVLLARGAGTSVARNSTAAAVTPRSARAAPCAGSSTSPPRAPG
jgi:hypothetical protein